MGSGWSILFLTGIILIITGGFIAALTSVEVDSYQVKIPVSEVRIKEPGNYTSHRTIHLNNTRLELHDGGPAVEVLTLEGPDKRCTSVHRYLTILGEGEAYTRDSILFNITITLEGTSWSRKRESSIVFNPEELARMYTSIQPTISPVMAESSGAVEGYARINKESNGPFRLSITIRGDNPEIEIPADTSRIAINISSNMSRGDVVFRIDAMDRCKYRYEVEYPIPESHTRYVSINIPTIRGVDLSGLKAGIILITLGNALVMTSIYGLLKNTTKKGKQDSTI